MGKPVAQAVNQVTAVVNKPLLEPAKVIANATKDIPVVSTVTQGVASAIDTPTHISGAIVDPSKKDEAKQVTIEGIKGGAVVAAAFATGGAAAGAMGVGQGLAGASLVNTALNKGLTPSMLAGLGEGLGYLPSGTAGFVDSLPNFNGGGGGSSPKAPGSVPVLAPDKEVIYANGKTGKDYTMLFVGVVLIGFLYLKGV